ncbi:hypothetical protein BDV96DRAFT_655512 [Lophiotrema nucula]|uniref:Uncharacterized protein n=1 Tax=Lophiotrema nucula TaxID=690887 RepID=A0A6A5YHE4_9PLEO|nr:hypothetical protein BDV96DRAFT_655512 [Lophiotrema nucula]
MAPTRLPLKHQTKEAHNTLRAALLKLPRNLRQVLQALGHATNVRFYSQEALPHRSTSTALFIGWQEAWHDWVFVGLAKPSWPGSKHPVLFRDRFRAGDHPVVFEWGSTDPSRPSATGLDPVPPFCFLDKGEDSGEPFKALVKFYFVEGGYLDPTTLGPTWQADLTVALTQISQHPQYKLSYVGAPREPFLRNDSGTEYYTMYPNLELPPDTLLRNEVEERYTPRVRRGEVGLSIELEKHVRDREEALEIRATVAQEAVQDIDGKQVPKEDVAAISKTGDQLQEEYELELEQSEISAQSEGSKTHEEIGAGEQYENVQPANLTPTNRYSFRSSHDQTGRRIGEILDYESMLSIPNPINTGSYDKDFSPKRKHSFIPDTGSLTLSRDNAVVTPNEEIPALLLPGDDQTSAVVPPRGPEVSSNLNEAVRSNNSYLLDEPAEVEVHGIITAPQFDVGAGLFQAGLGGDLRGTRHETNPDDSVVKVRELEEHLGAAYHLLPESMAPRTIFKKTSSAENTFPYQLFAGKFDQCLVWISLSSTGATSTEPELLLFSQDHKHLATMDSLANVLLLPPLNDARTEASLNALIKFIYLHAHANGEISNDPKISVDDTLKLGLEEYCHGLEHVTDQVVAQEETGSCSQTVTSRLVDVDYTEAAHGCFYNLPDISPPGSLPTSMLDSDGDTDMDAPATVSTVPSSVRMPFMFHKTVEMSAVSDEVRDTFIRSLRGMKSIN